MARTFNCGVGAVLVVQKDMAQQVLRDIQGHETAWLIGKVVSLQKGDCSLIFLGGKLIRKKKLREIPLLVSFHEVKTSSLALP